MQFSNWDRSIDTFSSTFCDQLTTCSTPKRSKQKKTFSQKQKLLEAHLKFNFNTQLAKLLKNSSVLARRALNVARWLLIARTAPGTEMLF